MKKQRTTALLTDPLPWWDKYVVRAGVQALAIRLSHVIAHGQLPELHRDPFDRILIAQSMVEKATLVSKDTNLKQYGIAIAW